MNKFTFDEAEARNQGDKDGVTHYCIGVATRLNGDVLVVRRVLHDSFGGMFELPGGGVDPGETITDAVYREMLEETGLKVNKITKMFSSFDFQTASKPLVRQFNFEVTTEVGEIILEPTEHDKYAWVNQRDLEALQTTEPMRAVLQNIV